MVTITKMRQTMPAIEGGPLRRAGYLHTTARGEDSDTEIEDCTRVREENGLWRPRGATGGTSAGPQTHGASAADRRTGLAAVPDLHGVRFCRVCEDFLPVSAFPRGQRRYTCRAHLWERNGKKAKKTLLQKPRKRLLARLWMQCYKDRTAFGHARVELTQADIDALLDTEPCMQEFVSVHGWRTGDAEAVATAPKPAQSAQTTLELAVLPRDPSKPLCKANAVLASKGARRQLLALALQRKQARKMVL